MSDSRTLADLFGKANYRYHPPFASIELTYACNMACTFCYNPVQRAGQIRTKPAPRRGDTQLSFDEIVALLDDLKQLNVLYLTITGGDPFMHPRFWDILAEAKKRSFAFRIFTNGIAIDEAAADRLAELAPFCLEISMHGATDATAEALNKVPGSHQLLLRALGLLRDRGVRVFLKAVVTELVAHELIQMKEIADGFGFPMYFDPVLTLSDDGETYPLDMQASDDTLRSLYSTTGLNVGNSPFERASEGLNCTVATGTLHIDPFGNVQPCVQWKEPGGNLRQQSLREIWETSEVFQYARKVNHALPAAIPGMTADHEFCAHCPGLSKLHYGGAMRPEEQYLRVARIRREMAAAEAAK